LAASKCWRQRCLFGPTFTAHDVSLQHQRSQVTGITAMPASRCPMTWSHWIVAGRLSR
jgi:hypothetical protein